MTVAVTAEDRRDRGNEGEPGARRVPVSMSAAIVVTVTVVIIRAARIRTHTRGAGERASPPPCIS